MKEEQIISWIYLAIAVASQTEPADFKEVSMIADGINHAVPTPNEFQTSISWLSKKGLISENGKKYELSSKGKSEYQKASENTNILLKIWDNLELRIKNYT